MKSTGYQVQQFLNNKWEDVLGCYSSLRDAMWALHRDGWNSFQYRIVKTTQEILSEGVFPATFQLDDIDDWIDG